MTKDAGALLKRGYVEGVCSFCGALGRFEGALRLARQEFACPACKATLRYRDQAAAILSQFAHGCETSLDSFVQSEDCRRLSVYEAAIRGPFVRRFRKLPRYTQSYFFEDLPLGEARQGVVCQDLERLTFADESFDLIVTSDVMEHVARPKAAIAEIARVLKPAGAHVFSIPIRFPIAKNSVERARIVDGRIEHLLEPRYHRSGEDEPSLVFTDFGCDLLDWHRSVGMRARFFNSHRLIESSYYFPTVIAVKAPGDAIH